MSENIEKTISELPIYEKKLLKALDLDGENSPEDIVERTGLDIKSVMSAAGSLASKDIIHVETIDNEEITLTADGLKYAESELPERVILDVLSSENEIAMKDLSKYLSGSEVKIAIGWLVRKNWAKINKGILNITDFGKEFTNKQLGDEKLLSLLLEKKTLGVSSLDDDLKEGLKNLNSRKNLIQIKNIKS
ncbi:MAG: phenylalanine--tRNA ligase subunit alpha, partial [Methanobrevibacter sp.]|nr:phenylalanine--tRNA ligase subunit alpha [Methanobrevibacter sp.]